MKIVDVKTVRLFDKWDRPLVDAVHIIPGREIVITKIATDEGIEGVSFVTGMGLAHGTVVVDTVITRCLREIVLGEDPFAVERIWNRMYRGTHRFGRRGAALRAMSAVDMALWDIKGKSTNQPIQRLLGGYREKVPVYYSGGYLGSIEDIKKEIQGAMEKGFEAFKIKLGSGDSTDIERVKAVREIVGYNSKLMLDVVEGWDVATAMRIISKLERYEPYWLEEPLSADNVDGYVMLGKHSNIPLAAGEHEYTRYGFKELIVRGAVHILQPDVTRVGGITEWMKICAIASAWDLPVAPHAVQELHTPLVGAIPNGLIVEFMDHSYVMQKLISQMLKEPLRAEKGYVHVSKKPGLGLEFNEDVIRKFSVSSTGTI